MIKSPLNHLVGRALVLHEYRKESLRARKAACFAFALPKRSGGFDGPNTSIHSYFQWFTPLVKFNPPTAAAISHAEGVFHIAKQFSPTRKGR